MKSLLVAAVVTVLLLTVQQVKGQLPSGGCTVSQDASNSSTLVFTLSPSISDILATRPDLKAPMALVQLLNNTITNPAMNVAKSIKNYLLKPFTSIFGGILPGAPSCEFFWISNQLVCTNVTSSNLLLSALCSTVSGISKVSGPGKFGIPLPLPIGSLAPIGCEEGGLWGLTKIGARAANAAGYTGQSIVVAGIDSGVRHTHQELRDNWRSAYGWYNGYNPSDTTPVDDNGHGTHTMGSIAGKTVGVAPGVQWIACKGCDSSASCGNTQLLRCLQWAACPDSGKLNCTTVPRVINNSWGGGQGDTTFNGALKVLATMGIINVFSAGNSGNGGICATVVSPADEPQRPLQLMSIGATDCNDTLGYFSSAGPTAAADIMGQLGITVSGPGVNILSSWLTDDNSTSTQSGTSMSSPYVAGAVAVLLSKNNALNYDQVVSALTKAAYQNPAVTIAPCGGYNTSQPLTLAWPNNYYGYGRIQLLSSLNLV